ncbi:ATP-binding protein [Kribbella sancticallisti]|uniref:ATP-binding protein n=1 Tax=Kribbella sancticallisti TaxID=460087 RepID=A0ABP4MZJ6_9ACTN
MSSGVEQARRYAALSGPFDPAQALRSIDQVESVHPAQLTAIAAGLSQACDKSTIAGTGQWLMRGAERRRTLEALAGSERVDDAVADRWETADDQPTRDLLNAITAEGIFSAEGVSAAVSAEPDRETLERLVVGLGRAGPLASQYGELPKVKAALTHLDFVTSAAALQDRGFFGREEEIARITQWLEAEFAGRPASALYIEGLPGVGKTTLLEEVAATLIGHEDEWVVVRFDFDRAGLDVQDMAGLTMELARQVSAQVPGAEQAIQQARHKAAGAPPGATALKGDSPELVPEDLGLALANALARPRRRVFLVLDTLEVLRGRGETHPGRLFDWLDQLAALAQISLAVVGAGRGDALDSTPDRVGVRLPLQGLDDASADHLLASLDVDQRSYELIRSIARGNPLALRLAAKFANERGPQALAKARKRGGMALAYLYRFVLSRIDDRDLRKLANPGLVVRRINADVIREVVGPQVGLRGLSPRRAEELFQALASQHWLVEPDPLTTGFLRHRSDMRSVLLPLLYESTPATAARIDRSAAKWFAARSEPWCAVESAYHRLQLMRREPTVPPIDPAILAQFDAVTISELPTPAQDVVHRNQGDRSTSFRGDRVEPGAALDPDAARELRSMNERSDWLEGNYVYDRAYLGAVFDPNSPDADVALTFLWRSGRWFEARRLLAEQGGWYREQPPLQAQLSEARIDAVCRLEMGAEHDFDAGVRVLRDEASLGRRVAKLVEQPSGSDLAGAALRFAIHRAGISVKLRSRDPDAVLTAIERWRPARPDGADQDPVDSAGWRRLTARTGPVDLGGAGRSVIMARSLAVLTPYADLVGTMSRLPDHQYLHEYAAIVRERLNEQGNLAPLGSQPWRDYVDTTASLALTSLTDLGLLAELVGVAAYVHGDRDLNLVARCAERWRRTIAGSWSYGTAAKPDGWDRAVDVTIADRLAALQAAPDAVERATAQLEAWCPERPREGDVLGLLRKRAPHTIEAATHAASDGSPEDAAAVLLGRYVPSAFVPAVAVLLGARRRQTQSRGT